MRCANLSPPTNTQGAGNPPEDWPWKERRLVEFGDPRLRHADWSSELSSLFSTSLSVYYIPGPLV